MKYYKISLKDNVVEYKFLKLYNIEKYLEEFYDKEKIKKVEEITKEEYEKGQSPKEVNKYND